MKAWMTIAALAAAAVVVPAIALAQGLNAQEAEQRFQEGKELFKKRKYQEAHIKFTEACAAHRTQQCPKNLALAEMRLGRHAESATHWREYMRGSDFATDANAADVRKFSEEELGKVGELSFVARDGAILKIDAVPIGKAPLTDTWFVVPGKHDAAASYGDETQSKSIEVEARKVTTVDLTPPAPPATATSAVPTVGTTAPPAPSAATPTAPPATTATSRPTAGYAVPITLGVLGLAGIALGVGEAFDSQGKRSDANAIANACSAPTSAQCASLQSLQSSMSSSFNLSVVGYVSGAALLAGGAVAYLLWPKTTEKQALVLPLVNKSTAGLSATLVW